ncbi:reverse transcriptase domain-containing protein, partial [Tanacetum coccineum]
MLEAPTEGYEDAIVVPEINANNFEIKHGLLNLVQNKQFFGHDKEDPHAHIRYFNKITSTMKFPNVPSTSVKLMLFPFSLEGAARIWLDKEPPRSILTWDDLVSKFINKFFPPSKTTNLRNEITRFQQRFDESFYEAWDRFNDLLRACPHHGFSELHQLDTFYNALNSNDQDSLNSAAGVSTITSTSGISPDVSELKDMVKALLLDKKNQSQAPAHQTPASVKAVEESCVTCSGAHSYQSCLATDDNVYHDNIQAYVSQAAAANFNQGNNSARPPMVNQPPAYQAPVYQAPAPQTQSLSKTEFDSYVKANDELLLPSGTHPGNTVTTNKEDLKGITTRSGVTIQGPKAVNHDAEVTKDTMPPANNGSTEDVQPPVVQIQTRNPNPEPNVAPVVTPVPKASIPFPSRRNDERRKEKANDQIEKFYEIFRDLSFEISFTDALMLMPKFASTLKTLIGNKEKLSELARTPLNENCSAVILNKLPKKLGDPGRFLIPCEFTGITTCNALADLGASINLMPYSVWKDLALPELTPTCMTLELADRSITEPIGIAKDVFVTEPIGIAKDVRLMVGKFQFPADFVVVDFEPDPRVPLNPRRKAITFNLDQTSRYTANYNHMTANRIDVIELACEEYSQEVLGFSDSVAYGNPSPDYDPIVSNSSPTLTPFGDSDFLLLEEANAFIAVGDEPISQEIDATYYDLEGDILILEALLNSEPLPPLPNHKDYSPEIREELKVVEAKSSFDEPPEVELKDLPPHLEYAFLEGDDNLRGSHLDKMLKRCEDTNLVLNWEKSHFMVKEGIVLGHKISKSGIEVDRAKVDVIAKLPHPTTVKGVRSFLGHA